MTLFDVIEEGRKLGKLSEEEYNQLVIIYETAHRENCLNGCRCGLKEELKRLIEERKDK